MSDFRFTEDEKRVLRLEIKRATGEQINNLIKAVEEKINLSLWLIENDRDISLTELKTKLREIEKASHNLREMIRRLPVHFRPTTGFQHYKTVLESLAQLAVTARRSADDIHPLTNSKPDKAQLKAFICEEWEHAMGKRPGKGKRTAYDNFQQAVFRILAEHAIRF